MFIIKKKNKSQRADNVKLTLLTLRRQILRNSGMDWRYWGQNYSVGKTLRWTQLLILLTVICQIFHHLNDLVRFWLLLALLIMRNLYRIYFTTCMLRDTLLAAYSVFPNSKILCIYLLKLYINVNPSNLLASTTRLNVLRALGNNVSL